MNRQWLSICGKGWTDEDAAVVCTQLDLPKVGECNKGLPTTVIRHAVPAKLK